MICLEHTGQFQMHKSKTNKVIQRCRFPSNFRSLRVGALLKHCSGSRNYPGHANRNLSRLSPINENPRIWWNSSKFPALGHSRSPQATHWTWYSLNSRLSRMSRNNVLIHKNGAKVSSQFWKESIIRTHSATCPNHLVQLILRYSNQSGLSWHSCACSAYWRGSNYETNQTAPTFIKEWVL